MGVRDSVSLACNSIRPNGVYGDALMTNWETLASAARRTGYAYSTFKKWHSLGRLPFPVYGLPGDIRVKGEEVDRWLEGTKRNTTVYLR